MDRSPAEPMHALLPQPVDEIPVNGARTDGVASPQRQHQHHHHRNNHHNNHHHQPSRKDVDSDDEDSVARRLIATVDQLRQCGIRDDNSDDNSNANEYADTDETTTTTAHMFAEPQQQSATNADESASSAAELNELSNAAAEEAAAAADPSLGCVHYKRKAMFVVSNICEYVRRMHRDNKRWPVDYPEFDHEC